MNSHETNCVLCRSGRHRILYTLRDYEHGIPGRWTMAQCADCGLCFHEHLPSAAEIASFYPESYSAYCDASPIDWMFKMVYWQDALRIAKLIGRRGSILDVGCGNGAALQALQKKGDWDLWGLELDQNAVSAGCRLGLKMFCGDLLSADLPVDGFDLIRMGHVIEHVTDPVGTMRQAYALLKPGGWIIGETPNSDCLDFRLFGRYWGGWHTPRHIVIFSRKTLRMALISSGFEDIAIYPRLRPVGWSAGIQNCMVDKMGLVVPSHGRVRWYVLLVALGVCVTSIQALVGHTATIAFRGRKRSAT